MTTSSVFNHTSALTTTNVTAPATAPKCNDDGHQCQVWVYSSKGSGQVQTETDEGGGQRLDKGLVWLELGPI